MSDLLIANVPPSTLLQAQARGYLEFYRSTRTLRQAPLFIVSLFTAILLLMATFLQQFPIPSSQSTPSLSSFKDDTTG